MRIILLGFLAGLISCSSIITIDGRRHDADNPARIDGKTDEWTADLQATQGVKIITGIRNDDDYIYFCMVPTDRNLGGQMLMQGFTVWFDPQAGKGKTLGLRYPIGVAPHARMSPNGVPGENFDAIMLERLSEMELLRPAVFGQERVKVNRLTGIETAIQIVEGRLVYELKFPLHDQGLHPYFIGANAGDEISIGLELNQPARPETLTGARDLGSGGVRPGGPAGSQGSAGRPRGVRMEPGKFELWVRARLADASVPR